MAVVLKLSGLTEREVLRKAALMDIDISQCSISKLENKKCCVIEMCPLR